MIREILAALGSFVFASKAGDLGLGDNLVSLDHLLDLFADLQGVFGAASS